MPDKERSVILRLLRTQLLFLGQVWNQLNFKRVFTYKPHASLNLRSCVLCLCVINLLKHDIMHHKHSFFITLTISRIRGIYLCSVLQIMASAHRNTIWISFVRIPLQLKELVSRVFETSSFTKNYGRLLNLVTSGFDEKMMSVLFQFFDPKNHCFTFPDYQLVPTM